MSSKDRNTTAGARPFFTRRSDTDANIKEEEEEPEPGGKNPRPPLHNPETAASSKDDAQLISGVIPHENSGDTEKNYPSERSLDKSTSPYHPVHTAKQPSDINKGDETLRNINTSGLRDKNIQRSTSQIRPDNNPFQPTRGNGSLQTGDENTAASEKKSQVAGAEIEAGDTAVEGTIGADQENHGLIHWLKSLLGRKSDETLRQAIEEYIEDKIDDDTTSLAQHEKTLISNVLKLRDLNAADVMIPRADIVSFDLNQPPQEFLALLTENPHSRVPVYKDSPDDILGTVHIKDVLKELASGKNLELEGLIREVPIVSPAMPILDLLLQMRQSRKHMVVVIDEFGGVDGLVTIGDLIEAIVGEFYDEHDLDLTPRFHVHENGTVTADARVSINDFEEKIKEILSPEEREDIDTLGGLVFEIAGRVPVRGEIIKHTPSGTVFEIIDADPRRVKSMRIRSL